VIESTTIEASAVTALAYYTVADGGARGRIVVGRNNGRVEVGR
jgi:hypothetical protein